MSRQTIFSNISKYNDSVAILPQLSLPETADEMTNFQQVREILQNQLLKITKLSNLLNNTINECTHIIENECTHQWIIDRDTYDPCMTCHICLKCNKSC